MKKSIILLIISFSYNCLAQGPIRPIHEWGCNNDVVPFTYFKDIHDSLLYLEGNWRAEYRGYTIDLELKRVKKKTHCNIPHYKDELVGSYTIKDSLNNILDSFSSDYSANGEEKIMFSGFTNFNNDQRLIGFFDMKYLNYCESTYDIMLAPVWDDPDRFTWFAYPFSTDTFECEQMPFQVYPTGAQYFEKVE